MIIIVLLNVSLFWFISSARLALTLEVAFLGWGGLISGHALRKSLVQSGGQRTSLWWVPWRKGPPRRSFFAVSPSALRSIWREIWSPRCPLELGDPRTVGRRSPQPENKILLPSRLVQKSITIFLYPFITSWVIFTANDSNSEKYRHSIARVDNNTHTASNKTCLKLDFEQNQDVRFWWWANGEYWHYIQRNAHWAWSG